MNKREFLKTTLLAGAATPLSTIPSFSKGNTEANAAPVRKQKVTHRAWMGKQRKLSDDEFHTYLDKLYDAGIRAVYIGGYDERAFKFAHEHNIEAHSWMWTMIRHNEEIRKAHPDWYTVNRKGESSVNTPQYVDDYNWLCPNHPEVLEHLEQKARDILEKPYVAGLHLDYIRFCDVILPVKLWEKYDIVQTSEHPESDYCYCDKCRTKFKSLHGIDPMDIKYPDQSLSWRNFRYDSITNVVNHLATVAASYKKEITAAVFPTPEVARRIVRQDWTNWNLHAVNPMIYHGFYNEDERWIGEAVAEGVRFLCGKFPLYAGLFMPSFKGDMKALKTGIEYAVKNGAAGVTIFGKIDDGVLNALKTAEV